MSLGRASRLAHAAVWFKVQGSVAGTPSAPSYVEHWSRSVSRTSRLAQAAERPAQLAPQLASQGPQAPNSRAGLRAVSAQGARAHGRRLTGRLGSSHSTAACCLRAIACVRAVLASTAGERSSWQCERFHFAGTAASSPGILGSYWHGITRSSASPSSSATMFSARLASAARIFHVMFWSRACLRQAHVVRVE